MTDAVPYAMICIQYASVAKQLNIRSDEPSGWLIPSRKHWINPGNAIR